MILDSITLSNIAIIAGSIITGLVGLFAAGFTFNKKIKDACADTIKEVNDAMIDIQSRVRVLELTYVPVSRYEKDLEDFKDIMRGNHLDIKSSVETLTKRIDTLMLGRA